MSKIQISLSAPLVQVGFRNKIQCALYEDELKGQMSDGLWENSKPRDHYLMPCRAKAIVASSPAQLGPSFYPDRAYNFASPQLIEYVGDRMLKIGQKINKAYTMQQLVKDLKDMSKIFNSKRSGNAVPDAPSPAGTRASPIKGGDKYSWYIYTSSSPTNVARRGQNTAITKGTKFGVRLSSSGKDVRLIFPGAETHVYTLTPDQQVTLLKSSKPA